MELNQVSDNFLLKELEKRMGIGNTTQTIGIRELEWITNEWYKKNPDVERAYYELDKKTIEQLSQTITSL